MTTVVIAVVPLITALLICLVVIYRHRLTAWLDWAILTLRKSRK